MTMKMTDKQEVLIDNDIHRHWWTGLLALPLSPDGPAHRALRRVWGDQTINTVFIDAGGRLKSKRGRGFYRADSEDHLMTVLFENWAALPDCHWVAAFAAACGCRVAGRVTRAGWSYEYTQDRPGKSPSKLTADIVLHWSDDEGPAVLVLEAKKPGNTVWAEKDFPSRGIYTDVPGYTDIARKFACLLISESDRRAKESSLVGEPVMTWERLASLQAEAMLVLDVPESVKGFMIGALVHQYAGYGILPDPLPLGWMRSQPQAYEIASLRQSRVERRVAYWREPRQKA